MVLRSEPSNSTDGAWFAELLLARIVEFSSTVELQGQRFHVNAQDPYGTGVASDVVGGENSGGGDVVLHLHFIDCLCIFVSSCCQKWRGLVG